MDARSARKHVVEYGEGHEVFRVKAFLVIVEVALRILHAWVLLALLQHLAASQTGQADFLLHAGNDHHQPFLDNLVAGGGERQKLLQYLAVVIGVLYYYCHVFYLLSLSLISRIRLFHGLSPPGSTFRSSTTLRLGDNEASTFLPSSGLFFRMFSYMGRVSALMRPSASAASSRALRAASSSAAALASNSSTLAFREAFSSARLPARFASCAYAWALAIPLPRSCSP